MKVLVRIIKDVNDLLKKGTEKKVSKTLANQLVREGVAEVVSNDFKEDFNLTVEEITVEAPVKKTRQTKSKTA